MRILKYYCQRCGRKIDAEARICSSCGVAQDRFDTTEETKPCKNCRKQIPVNSNYCIFCAADQAKLYTLDFDSKQEETKKVPEDKEQVDEPISGNLDNYNSFMEKLAQTAKEENEELNKIKGTVNSKNETEKPGLVASTKLFLQDWLTINKRVGRADFWWGFIGMIIITALFAILLELSLSVVQAIMPSAVETVYTILFRLYLAFYFIAIGTGLCRRYHDAELPWYAILLYFVPVFGEILALILATKEQSVTNDKYTFIDPVRELRKKGHK